MTVRSDCVYEEVTEESSSVSSFYASLLKGRTLISMVVDLTHDRPPQLQIGPITWLKPIGYLSHSLMPDRACMLSTVPIPRLQ